MEKTAPLAIKRGQHVTLDCAGHKFSMDSSKGNLTMGPDSSLHFIDCHLQGYVFPEGADVRDTVHQMSNSTFEMQSCRFVVNLNDQYAPLIVQLQSNASFDLGERVDRGAAAAVHIFTATFDSLIGPQFRYEIFNSTAFCGADAGIVAEAYQRATSNSPDVIAESEEAGPRAGGQAPAGAPGANAAAAAAAGEAPGVSESSRAPARPSGALPAWAAAVAAPWLAAVLCSPTWL